MIRTLQDHGIHCGMQVHMECTVLSLLMDSGRVAGACGYDREKASSNYGGEGRCAGTGGIGRAFKVTSTVGNHRDGLALGITSVPNCRKWSSFSSIHGHGLAHQCAWHPVTEGVRGEGGVLRNSEAEVHFDEIPELYRNQTATQKRKAALHQATEIPPAARTPHPRPRCRCINREVKAGRGTRTVVFFSILPGSSSTFPKPRSTSSASCPACHHQFKQLADLDITKEPMEVDHTHYMMGGIRVDGDPDSACPGYLLREKLRPDCTAPIGWWQFAFGSGGIGRRAAIMRRNSLKQWSQRCHN